MRTTRRPEPEEEHEPTGLDLARVDRPWARRAHGAADHEAGRATAATRAASRGSSGAHPDDRDPQTLDVTLGRFVDDQGWETELRVHGVFSRWEAIVGHEVAQHVTPESFADGRLVVRTDSTAWATQMKLLAAEVVRRLNDVLGDETVPRDRRGRTPGSVVGEGPAAGQGPWSPRHLRLSGPRRPGRSL